MKKALGYLITAIGAIALVLASMPPVQKMLPIIPASLATSKLFLWVSLVIFAIGIIIVIRAGKSSKQAPEVPIYDKDGKTIVGYRRMTK